MFKCFCLFCSIAPALKRLSAGFAYTLLYQVASIYFTDNYMITESFQVSTPPTTLHAHRIISGECLTHYTVWSQSHSRWVSIPLYHMITESFQVSVPPTTRHDHKVIPGECPTHYTTCPQSYSRWVPHPLYYMPTESFQVSGPPTTLHDHIVISGECPLTTPHDNRVIPGECPTYYTICSQSHSR